MNKVFIVSLGLILTTIAQAAPLDLGSLASFDYAGRDDLSNRSACRLVASPIRQDFSGRLVQDYRFWTEGRADLNFNLRLKGPNRMRDGQDMGNGKSEYSIVLDAIELVIIGETNNPTNILEFRVKDASGVSGNPTTLMKCQEVRATPRL
jgi:hypothetical protein